MSQMEALFRFPRISEVVNVVSPTAVSANDKNGVKWKSRPSGTVGGVLSPAGKPPARAREPV